MLPSTLHPSQPARHPLHLNERHHRHLLHHGPEGIWRVSPGNHLGHSDARLADVDGGVGVQRLRREQRTVQQGQRRVGQPDHRLAGLALFR